MAEKISQVKKQLSNDELASLILLGTLIIGIWLRLNPAVIAGFPMNDGGMFYTMIRDLRQNNYILPTYTTYNNLNIPYTYPPVPFYLAGFLADIFHISDLTILLWLPALINILTLPAFALLANSMLESRLKAALATSFYALTPLSMDWFLMGGGLTRGMGQLFLLLTTWGTYQLFSSHSKKYLLLTILSGALVVLCHPESALLTVTSVAILWFFSSRSRQTVLDALLAGAGVTILCAPWLFYVLRLNGVAPFINAMQTSGNSLFLWISIFPFNFTQETGLALLAILGLIGMFVKLGKKEYLLPVWVIIPFFINPRSSSRASIIPLAMLAAISLLDMILPAIQGSPSTQTRSGKIAGNLFVGYLLIYFVINNYGLDFRMASNRLSDSDRQAMTWISQNTPADSKFIIITGESQMLRDPIQEWFPALTERTSQTTLQGREWIWGNRFISALTTYQDLKLCILQDLQCVQEQTQKLGIEYDHVYISKPSFLPCSTSFTCQYSQGLINELNNSKEYELAFENNTVAIFRRQ
jgi:hypothetical protein